MVDQVNHCSNNRPGRPWYIVDVILFGGLVMAYGALVAIVAVMAYLLGLQREPPLFVCAWLLLALTALVLLFLTAIIHRMVQRWGRHIDGRYRLWGLRLFVATIIIGYLALPFTRLGMPRTKGLTAGFRRYVKANVDLNTIQVWLNSRDPNACSDYVYDLTSGATLESWWPDAAPWAKAITLLHPHSATLSLSSERCPTIRIRWFGWSRGWGLTVGDPSIVTPPSDLSRHGEYRLLVAPGAYVWHEL
jgi:hypothetical protein